MKTVSLFLLCFSLHVCGQDLKRQSTNTSGGSSSGGNIRLAHTIGQPYDTKNPGHAGTDLHAGFQQPVFSTQVLFSEIVISLIPNPALHAFAITAPDTLLNVSIIVRDMAGREIFRDFLKSFTSYQVDCANWANGTYMIALVNEKKNLVSAKLVKHN